MRFGPCPVDKAQGAILAHSVPLSAGGRLRKGMVLDGPAIAALRAAGVREVTVACPGPDDVPEDAAAARLASALLPAAETQGLAASSAATGRVNILATGPGVLGLRADAIHRLNLIHPSITLATLAPLHRVAKDMLCATVKIITYAVPEAALTQACVEAQGALWRVPVALPDASLVLTEVPGMDTALAAKGRRAIEGRLRALGMRLQGCETVPHRVDAISAALSAAPGAMLLILTGSATSDGDDVAPAALRACGGRVARFGMPVDPGNLLFHGTLGEKPVIGLPGCARSPALNGADWVLERLACGLAVSDEDIARMGIGGLLKEIPLRPRPREADPAP